MDKLLRDLLLVDGISGYEENVANIIEHKFKHICNNVMRDTLGNIIGKLTLGTGARKIMLAAHMDEIGMVVKYIDDHGFIRFIKVGGINDSILLGKKVKIINKNNEHITGIIGVKPPHIMDSAESKRTLKSEDMFIDIGINSKDKVSKIIEIGDPIIFDPQAGILYKSVCYGKAVDNRIGCYIMIKVLEQLFNKQNIDVEVYACATVQEEVGLKGGRTAAFNINPDFALILDTTIAGDTPEIKKETSSLELGKGVAITILEACGRGAIITSKVRNFILGIARTNNILHQIDIIDGGMTDATSIQLVKNGMLSGILSIPTRYIHAPISVFSIRDVQSTIMLATRIIEQIKILL
jgi:endoglucanase